MPYRPLVETLGPKYVGCDFETNTEADEALANIGMLPLSTSSADLILSTQVLEHVVDPGRYLREANRVLRSGGVLILSTHGVWKYHPDPTDFWRWTCDGLKRVIKENGFQLEEFSGVLGPPATAESKSSKTIFPTISHD